MNIKLGWLLVLFGCGAPDAPQPSEVEMCGDAHPVPFGGDEDITEAVRDYLRSHPDMRLTSGPHVRFDDSPASPGATPDAPYVAIRFKRGESIFFERYDVRRVDSEWRVEGVIWTCRTR